MITSYCMEEKLGPMALPEASSRLHKNELIPALVKVENKSRNVYFEMMRFVQTEFVSVGLTSTKTRECW